MRHFARGQVGLVQRGAGDKQVGVFGARAAQHRGLDAIARHATQVQPVFEVAQQLGVRVDQGDVVLLGNQAFGHTFANAPGSQNDDAHKGCLILEAS